MSLASQELLSLNIELTKAIQRHQVVTQMLKTCEEQTKKEELELETKVWIAKILDINNKQKSIKNQIRLQQEAKVTGDGSTGGLSQQQPESHSENEVRNGKEVTVTSKAKQENGKTDDSPQRSFKSDSTPTPPKRKDMDDSPDKGSPNQVKSLGRKKVVFNKESPSPKVTRSSSSNHQVLPSSSHGMYEDLNDADDSVLQPVVVTDELRKEHFLSGLGLVTKAALHELQNKKSVRKRRTTANPHFSNAAIEAKRINQLELQARKAKRKELMKTRYSLKVDSGRRRHKRDLEDDEDEDPSSLRRHHHSKHESGRHQSSKSLMPSLAVNSPPSKSLSEVPKECCYCSEACETDTDAIMFCPSCRVLFHMTCASTVEEMASSGVVPCPLCERNRPVYQQVKDMDSILSSHEMSKVDQEQEVPLKKKMKKAMKEVPKPKETSSPEMVTLNRENGTSARVSIKSHYDEKRSELMVLLEKKSLLESEWNQRREQYEAARNNFSNIKDKSMSLLKTHKTWTSKIDRLVGFIKSVKIWRDIIDPEENKAKQQTAQQQQASNSTLKKVDSNKQVILPASHSISVSPIPPVVTYTAGKKTQSILCKPNGVSGSPVTTTVLTVPAMKTHELVTESNSDRRIGVILVPTCTAGLNTSSLNTSVILPKTPSIVSTSITSEVKAAGNGSRLIPIAPKPVTTETTQGDNNWMPHRSVVKTPSSVRVVSVEGSKMTVLTPRGNVVHCKDDLTLLDDHTDDHTMDEPVMDPNQV